MSNSIRYISPTGTAGVLMFCVVFLLGTTTSLPGQETSEESGEPVPEAAELQDNSRAELQNILRQKIEKLQNIRERTYEARQQADRQLQTAMSKRNALEKDLKELKARHTRKKEDLKQLKNRITSLKQKKTSLTTSVDTLSSATESLRDALSSHVNQTAPYRKAERTSPLASDPSPEHIQQQPIDVLRDLLEATRNELSDGRTAELFHERVPLSSASSPRKKYARLVRIGQNTLFFVTEDGKQAGYYTRENGAWIVKPASSDQKRAFQRAIDILRGHRPPARVPLPVIIQQNLQ